MFTFFTRLYTKYTSVTFHTFTRSVILLSRDSTTLSTLSGNSASFGDMRMILWRREFIIFTALDVIVARSLYHHATSHIILRAPLSVSGPRTSLPSPEVVIHVSFYNIKLFCFITSTCMYPPLLTAHATAIIYLSRLIVCSWSITLSAWLY